LQRIIEERLKKHEDTEAIFEAMRNSCEDMRSNHEDMRRKREEMPGNREEHHKIFEDMQ